MRNLSLKEIANQLKAPLFFIFTFTGLGLVVAYQSARNMQHNDLDENLIVAVPSASLEIPPSSGFNVKNLNPDMLKKECAASVIYRFSDRKSDVDMTAMDVEITDIQSNVEYSCLVSFEKKGSPTETNYRAGREQYVVNKNIFAREADIYRIDDEAALTALAKRFMRIEKTRREGDSVYVSAVLAGNACNIEVGVDNQVATNLGPQVRHIECHPENGSLDRRQ